MPSHAPLERVVELTERDLPLAEERDFVGYTGKSTTPLVVGPGLGEVHAQRDAGATRLAS